MRLIDADELIEALKEDYDDADIQKTLEFFGIYDFIENQPTAFDVEKVVEQLEEEREYSYANFEEYVCDKSFGSDVECDDFFHKGLERAIEIVKRGGIDG